MVTRFILSERKKAPSFEGQRHNTQLFTMAISEIVMLATLMMVFWHARTAENTVLLAGIILPVLFIGTYLVRKGVFSALIILIISLLVLEAMALLYPPIPQITPDAMVVIFAMIDAALITHLILKKK